MKKTLRKILSLVLVFVMTLCLANVAYADDSGIMPYGGTETWNKGGGMVGEFTLAGTNLTPVKTMGASGYLRVYGFANSYSNSNAWYVKVEIKDADTFEIIADTITIYPGDDQQVYSVSLNVTKGQRIRIYTYYGEAPSHDAKVSINYQLT